MGPAILIVSSQVRSVQSGVGTYAAMILAGLGALPAESLRITIATWQDEIDPDVHAGMEWIDLGERPSLDPTPGSFLTLSRRLLRRLRRDGCGFDIVHFLDAREGQAFVRSPLRRGVRVLGTVHDDYAALVGRSPRHYVGKSADPWRRYLFHHWLRRIEKRSYKRFDLLMVNSAATRGTLRRVYGIDPERMVDVSLTVEPVAPDVPPMKLDGLPRLVFSGGNFYRKGLDVCIAAMPALLRELPSAQLHVAGQCRSAARIHKLVDDLGVGSAVVFHGQVESTQMAAMLGGADVFVMPSRTEALGLVYLEAFRAGVPVIAGDRGGVTDIVQDRRSGILVTPGCPEALANSIVMLSRNDDLRAQVIAGGYEVLADRPPEKLTQQTLAAYGIDYPQEHESASAPAAAVGVFAS